MAGKQRESGTRESKETASKSSLQRHPGLYVFSIFILVLIVVTFIGAPAVTGTSSRGQLSFGRYDKTEISYQQGNYFARQYDSIAQTLRDAGDGSNLELQLRLAWREAFNRTVLHTAVLKAADDAGLRVSENRVDELLATSPQFQENGRFSAALYSRLSNQERYNIRKFYRESEMFQLVVDDVLVGGKTSESESEFVASMASPERSFRVVRFPFTDFPDEEVISYAEENKDLFTTLNLQVVTLSNEGEAEQVLSQARSGSPVDDLARTYSRDVYADQGGSMGEISAHEIERLLSDPTDLEQILNLSAGESSGLLETVGGWAFYTAVSDPEPLDISDPDRLAQVREYIEIYAQGLVQDYARERGDAFAVSARESSILTTATDEGLEVLETPTFPINYGNVPIFGRVQADSIPDLADAAYNTQFLETAFSLKDGEVSNALILRESAVVISTLEEQEVESETMDSIVQYYPYLTQQYQSEEIEPAFVDRDKLEDNFNQAFARYILGNG